MLARIIHRIPEPLYANTHNVFEDLASCVLDMRIHYAGSKAAFRYKRFKRLMNDAPLAPDSLGTMPREVLTELKLSRQKHETLELLGAFWRAERLDEVEWTGLTDAEVLDRLAGVKGIGEWTVQMILIFTLERPDILPMTDYQFRKAMCELYHLPEDKQLTPRIAELAEAWSPYRSLAVRYLWRWREAR